MAAASTYSWGAVRRGFTLIELLVVVGVISILTAILFPAFGEARESARGASCTGNLRQIGSAVQMYSQDYDETLPNAGSGDDLTGSLEPYAAQSSGPGIWQCPSFVDTTGIEPTSSYGYNWEYLLAAGPDYPHSDWEGFDNSGLALSALRRPAETLMFIDQAPQPDASELWSYVARPSDPSQASGQGQPAFRHHHRANALFCDGHVRSVSPVVGQPESEAQYWDAR